MTKVIPDVDGYDTFLTKAFAAKGIGKFEYKNIDGYTQLVFDNPKDRFTYDLLGGDRWRWRLISQHSFSNFETMKSKIIPMDSKLDPANHVSPDWTNFLDTAFKEKHLGTWRFDQGTSALIGTLRVHNFSTVSFDDPKDQFRYELLGGNEWRVKLFLEWFNTKYNP